MMLFKPLNRRFNFMGNAAYGQKTVVSMDDKRIVELLRLIEGYKDELSHPRLRLKSARLDKVGSSHRALSALL